MQLNWANWNFDEHDGYGRWGRHMVRTLLRLGHQVTPVTGDTLALPSWMHQAQGLDLSHLTISCMPPFRLAPTAGRQWAFTMTEGDDTPDGWRADIERARSERVLVPCEHNRRAFRRGGVDVPVDVIPGGTDPAEFPLLSRPAWRKGAPRPYTFLALGDRGCRKGWVEVWDAFYRAFGAPADTPDVRLLIKARPGANEMLEIVAGAQNRDPRLVFWLGDAAAPSDIYALCDCFAIPSRSEGWGMPQREAAMMGIPVITLPYSGVDDGHTREWSLVVETMHYEAISRQQLHVKGGWMKADITELAAVMRHCYDEPEWAWEHGQRAAAWLRENQTWEHAARALLQLIEEHR